MDAETVAVPIRYLNRLRDDLAMGHVRSALGHARYIVDHFANDGEGIPEGWSLVDPETRAAIASAMERTDEYNEEHGESDERVRAWLARSGEGGVGRELFE